MDKDVVHIYNGLLLSHEKNEIIPIAATWMDLEIITVSEVCQTGKDKYHMLSFICGILKKMTQMNLFTKQKQTHIENKLMVTKGERCRGRDKLRIWE